MADQRPTFRFRLPWLTGAPAPPPRPALGVQTPAPPPSTQPPAQPTASAATAQGPPFRPPGIAPAQLSPPPAQAPTRAESQPPSPSRTAPQSRITSQPASPSRATSQSQPSTPSRPASQPSQAASPPQLPTRIASQPAGQTSSLPPSPTITAPQMQQPAAVTRPQSPPKTSQSTQESTQLPSSSTQPPPQQEESKDTGPAEITSESQMPVETTSQPHAREAQSPEISSLSKTTAQTPSQPEEKTRKPEETKQDEEAKQEIKDNGKTNGVSHEEPRQRTEELISKLQTKEQPITAAPSDTKQQPEEKEILSTKEILTTSVSNGKPAKTTISQPKDRGTVSETGHKFSAPSGEKGPLHKEIRDDISTLLHKMTTGDSKHTMDGKPLSVITLAGENRGASMQLGSDSAKREGAIHIRRGYKINPDESAEATADQEGSSRGEKPEDSKTKDDQPTKAYVNNNVQGLNNSVVFNSSVTEHDPGVHLALTLNTKETAKAYNEKAEPLEARKAEFNVISAQKLTYEPQIRRRCLRGLFLEPSDSDPDNPEKPRRHGCKYGCGERSKDNEIDVV